MILSRADRRAALKALKKKHAGKMTNKELFELYAANIQSGKETHKAFTQQAESINSEIEGKANYEMYEHLLEFYKNDEEKAQAEYKKILDARENKLS